MFVAITVEKKNTTDI